MIAPSQFVAVVLIGVLFSSACAAATSSEDDDELNKIHLELFGDGKSPPSVILTPEETLERVKRAHSLLIGRSADKDIIPFKYNIKLLLKAATIDDDRKCSEKSLDQRQRSITTSSGHKYAAIITAYLKRQAQLQFAHCAAKFAQIKEPEEESVRGQLELLVEMIDGVQAAAAAADQQSKRRINVPVPDELTLAKGILAYMNDLIEPTAMYRSLTRQQLDRFFDARIASLCRQVKGALGWDNVFEKFLGSDLLDLVDKKILYWVRANGICWRTYGARTLAFIIAPAPETAHSSVGASGGGQVMCSAESLAKIHFIFRDKTRNSIKTNQTLSDRIKLNLCNCAYRITNAAATLLEERELKKLTGFASMVNQALGFGYPDKRAIRTLAKSMIRMMKKNAEGTTTSRFRFRQMDKEKFQQQYSSTVDQVCSARILDQLEQPATLFLTALQTDEKLLSQVNREALDLVNALEACNKVKFYREHVWDLYHEGIEWDMIFAQ